MIVKPAKDQETTAMSLRLPLDLYDRFTKHCKKQGVTLSEGLRQVITEYLNKNERASK